MPLVGDAHSVFGVIWPNEAAVTHLHVDGSMIPPAASPLERADDRYDQGQFVDALAQYEEQVRAGGDVVAEARCESGMCLNAMNRPAEAAAAFEAVLNSPGDRLGGCGRRFVAHSEWEMTGVQCTPQSLREFP